MESNTEDIKSTVDSIETKTEVKQQSSKTETPVSEEMKQLFENSVSAKSKKTLKKYKSVNMINLRVAAANNTCVSMEDENGKTILIVTAGKLGFRHTKKPSPFAAEQVCKVIIAAMDYIGKKSCSITMSGSSNNNKISVLTWLSRYLDVTHVMEDLNYKFNGAPVRSKRYT